MGDKYYNSIMYKIHIQKAVRYWADSAAYDLEVADSLFEKGKFHYSLFFGHLALEKILKAIYVRSQKAHAPITHSLPYLAKRSGMDLDQARMQHLAEFMQFYVEGRYPKNMEDILKKYDRKFTAEQLTRIREMFQWLQKKLK